VSERTLAIEVDEFLPHPPERVWAALTDPEELVAWFMPNDFRAEVGHRFTLDTGHWGTTHCEVLVLDAPRRLRYSWRNGELDTDVTWELAPEGHGTRLIVTHEGFDPDQPIQRQAYDGMSGGWRSAVLAELRHHLGSASSG
jgi:uncharacterized protein YndB with AHSA1/START domain